MATMNTSLMKTRSAVAALALLAFGAAAPAFAAETHGHDHSAAAPAGAEEEKKEQDVFTDAPADQALVGRLLMIKGHLLVGKELYTQNRPDDAVPHYLHPSEEIYGLIKPELTKRKIASFETPLNQLYQMVKQKKPAAKVFAKQDEVVRAIDAALAKPGRKVTDNAAFVMDTTAMVLVQSVEEYKESFAGETIANAVEYQDSRGFVWAARAHLDQHAKALKAKNADAFAKVARQLDAVQNAYPAAVPPQQPVTSAKGLYDMVAEIEKLAPAFR
ncbi:hypothetical protein [Azospirillum sp. sgz301742]